MPLEPLSPLSSLSERAYAEIRRAILSLELKPGEFVSIGDLAQKLQVSRTPVRDALLVLEREGLVRLVPHKGAYISEISARDVEEIFELRILLESYAARLAAPLINMSELETLERVLNESRQAIDEKRYLEASDKGRLIHDMLVQKAGNSRLISLLSDLDTHYTRFRHFSALIPGRLEQSHQQHLRILAALRVGNAEQVGRAMADHLSSVRDELLASIEAWLANLHVEAATPESDRM
jgi:DNA-binding GntR family transcriptional regulator